MSLVILDPNLAHPHGHHLEWDLAVAAAARDRGQGVTIFAHRDCTVEGPEGIEVIPWFSAACYDSRHPDPVTGRFDDFRAMNDTIAEELALIPHDRLLPTDAVLVPTLNESHLLGYVTWAKTFDPARAPLFVLYLMYPSGIGIAAPGGAVAVVDPLQALFYALAFRRAAEPGPALHFFGGGRQLAGEFSRLSGLSIEAHPIPSCPARRTGLITSHARPAAMLFVGDAKMDKGIALLPDLARRLCERYPDWDFLVHANAGSAWGPALDAYTALLDRAPSLPNLRLRTGRLNRDDYLDLMEAADCLVFTYDPAAYARKSSGILWEAISLGLPVVVPGDTWLSREAEDWAAGYATYLDWTTERIGEALEAAMGDLAALQDRSAAAALDYRALNGASKVLDQIGRFWVQRLMTVSLVQQPGRRTLALEAIEGIGWSFPEVVADETVRWIGLESEIAFEWPFRSPWKLEILVADFIGEDQLTQLHASADGRAVTAVGTVGPKGGGRVAIVGEGCGRRQPTVKLLVRLPWSHRPENDTRDLGLLVRAVHLGPATDGPAAGAADAVRLSLLSPVELNAAQDAFRLERVVSARLQVDPHRPHRFEFRLHTASDPDVVRAIRLFANGIPVALDVAALREAAWLVSAYVDVRVLSGAGYQTDLDIVCDRGLGVDTWLRAICVDGQPVRLVLDEMLEAPEADQPTASPPALPEAGAAAPAPDLATARPAPDRTMLLAGSGEDVVSAEDVRLDGVDTPEDGMMRLTVLLDGVTLRSEAWEQIRFELCLDQSGVSLVLRCGEGWPDMFDLWLAADEDAAGPFLRLTKHSAPDEAAVTPRDNLLLKSIALLLPSAVAALQTRTERASPATARTLRAIAPMVRDWFTD